MLRKTTVYLSDAEVTLLRKKAATRHITVAEAIRQSIQEACQPKTKEEKTLWNSLDQLWAKMEPIPASKVESAVNRAVKEIRNGRKARRRS